VQNSGVPRDVDPGGKILNEDTLKLMPSTLSGQVAAVPQAGYGDRLHNLDTATLTPVVVSTPLARSSAGNVEPIGGTLVFLETTISGNTSGNTTDNPPLELGRKTGSIASLGVDV